VREERKSVTETDLITVDNSPIQGELPVAAKGAGAAGTVATGSLSTMVLPELRALASRVGVRGTSGMRKSELIAAIRENQNASAGKKSDEKLDGKKADGQGPTASSESAPGSEAPEPRRRERRAVSRDAGAPSAGTAEQQKPVPETSEAPAAPAAGGEDHAGDRDTKNRDATNPDATNRDATNRDATNRDANNRDANNRDANNRDANNRDGNNRDASNRNTETRQEARENREPADQGGEGSGGQRDDDGDGRQGRRGRRFRDRRRRGERAGGEGGGGGESELREDDVVQPVAGILDVLDNYAFVRTSGYLAGPNDVYVSMNMVRKNGLRRGDAVTGAVRVPKEGDQSNQRQKFNPLVRLDSVNGGPVEDAKKRPEFGKLTPLYPNQRLRLETTPERLTTRVIDLIMPIGKGQRALIVSPPKAGKTTILQDIANAITRNNPECHLMVVLVDERPEEVTDMTRSVKGEVIASTFDRPPSDHTSVAELAIERAKRLVEQGKDVVVLLDSITRLGRAYNNASPASGRILSGGVDSTALYPPKRFLGAARNIEHGGSLTIIATAMVETGSTGDTVIFEEFKGTGNAELKLDRKIAERRVFPAVDVNPSGTRKDELLLSPDEFAIVHKLRRVLSGLDSHQAIDLLMSQLRKTKTNYEFLVQVSKTAPGATDSD
jgi:transcription termination factor Rho